MWLFGRTVSDEEWARAVKPFLIAARTSARVVSDAVAEVNAVRDATGSPQKPQTGHGGEQRDREPVLWPDTGNHAERARRVADACANLASVRKSISDLPGPNSAEGRRAKKSLVRALRLYPQCAKRVGKLLQDLGGDFGRNYAKGRIDEAKWMGMETASLRRIVEDAGGNLDVAARFVDARIPNPNLRTPK